MNIGIDIGGSHIGIGMVNHKGKIIKKEDRYISIKDRMNIKNFIERHIIQTLKRWEKNDGVRINRIGIAAAGNVKDNWIKYSVNLGLYEYDLKSKIKKHFPYAKITIKNDAKCAAIAEKKFGALKPFGDCVFLCLGTGIGGAYFYKSQLVEPKRSSGFEFGHIIIESKGEVCRCGSRGCFEQYASMRKFKNTIRYNMNLPSEMEGKELRNYIKKNIDSGIVSNVIDEYLEKLCVGISSIVNILEPEAICIGGGFSSYQEILLDRFREKFYNSKQVFYKDNMPKIMVAELGNSAGIIGAALS